MLISNELDKFVTKYELFLSDLNSCIEFDSFSQEAFFNFRESLNSINKEISEIFKDNNDFIKFEEDLSMLQNLKMLNNYYSYLLSEAFETRNRKKLTELKYHLIELCRTWRGL